jgi:hypothetical protein
MVALAHNEKLHALKKHEGKMVEYFYRGKYRQMLLAAVQTEEGVKINGTYMSFVGDVRLNYTDGKTRDWNGFWTTKLRRIKV